MQILFQAVLMSMCYYCSRSVLCFGKVSQLSKLHDRKCPNNASYVTEHLQRSPKCQAFVGGTNTGVTLRYACNVKRRTNATSHFKEIQFFISYIYLLRALIIHTNKFINVIKHVTLLYMYNYINTCSRGKKYTGISLDNTIMYIEYQALWSLFMFKTNRQLQKNQLEKELTFYGIWNSCKQKHGMNLVYKTKNCELCILLITL